MQHSSAWVHIALPAKKQGSKPETARCYWVAIHRDLKLMLTWSICSMGKSSPVGRQHPCTMLAWTHTAAAVKLQPYRALGRSFYVPF
jgi:hypothetical protein